MNPIRTPPPGTRRSRSRTNSPKRKKQKGTIYKIEEKKIFENHIFHKDGPPQQRKKEGLVQ